jgi:hypothetical protein
MDSEDNVLTRFLLGAALVIVLALAVCAAVEIRKQNIWKACTERACQTIEKVLSR